ADLGDVVVPVEAVIFFRAVETVRMQYGDQLGLETRILQPFKSAHRQPPGRRPVARAPALVVETLRAVDAQADIRADAPKQRDPVLVDGDAVRLHREARLLRRDRSQAIISVLVPANG